MHVRNNAIQGLRGLGAITVFIWHIDWLVNSFFKISPTCLFRGDFANPMFFMIAGFFVGLLYDYKSFNTKKYIFKRIESIYPLYFLTVITALLYKFFDYGFTFEWVNWSYAMECMPHFLLLQSWIPYYDQEFLLNGPAWFLSTMLFFWVLTKPMLKLVNHCHYTKKSIIISGTIMIFTIGTYVIDRYNLIKTIPEIIRPYNYCPYFLGIVIGYSAEEDELFYNKNNNYVKDFTFLVGLFVLILLRNILNRVLSFTLLIPYLMTLILYIYKNEDSYLGRVLSNPALVSIGNVSLEFYLIHIPILGLFYRLQPYMSEHLGNLELVIISFICTWLFAKAIVSMKSKCNTLKKLKEKKYNENSGINPY